MDEQEQEELGERLREAAARAGAVAGPAAHDYLSLRAANDALRERGLKALFDAFTAIAGEANRHGAALRLARAEGHRFRVGNSTMVGTRLTLSRGVRALHVEAGWPRAPLDGIVRGGGLACARLTHFGAPAAGEDLLLVLDPGGTPLWVVPTDAGHQRQLSPERMCQHVLRLLSE